jgi:aminomuconate-semialdehyde/2-hydroxymuconate-6-semialdehyde dehydrogenase
VERAIRDEFLERFVAVASAMRTGDPRDPATQVGPLASAAHYDKVTGYLERVPAEGGEILCGGPANDGTWVVRPAVVTGAPEEAPICREEVFGPVVTVAPFDDEEQAVRLANHTPYGLNAMLFTENVRRAHRVAAHLRAGTVWVNCFFVRDLRAPFGGVGDSGIGREGGDFSREFCTEPKAVVMEL